MTGRDLTPLTGAGGEQPGESGTVLAGPISLPFLKGALRRRRRVWIATALVGLMLGASYRVVEPPKYKAVADLYLLEPSNADPNITIANEANLAQTVPVATLAVKEQNWNVPPLAVLSSYKATATGNQILRITAKAKYQVAAVAIANAVAHAFLDFRNQSIERQNQINVAALEKEIQGLQSQVGPGGALTTSQTAAQVQIDTLQNQINADNQQVASLTKNSSVIDPAALLAPTRKKVVIKDGVAGLIGGLALGMALVITQAILSDRPRRRDEIAEALGAPVELSVGPYRRPFVMRKRRLATRVTHPSPEMKMVARRLSSRLEQAPGAALAVVSVECSEPAALAVASVARSLAEEGGRVTIVDLAEGRPLQSLFKLPELDPAGLGEVDFHSAPQPKKSFLVRAEEWRQAHGRRDDSMVRRPSRRRRPAPATTTRPVVSPTNIRDPLGSWAAWDMRHQSVSKWSRDGSGQFRAWGSFRPPEPQPADDAWENLKIRELAEPILPPVEEPTPAAHPPSQSEQDNWEEEDSDADWEEAGEAQPQETSSAGALSRLHPSPVPLVAKRGSVTVVTGPDDPSQIGVHRSNNGVDAVLVLATVNPAFGAGHIASWATESVVMISAGAASGARLTSTAQMLENGGIKVDSAILVGADRHDETVGLAGHEQSTGNGQDRNWTHTRTWGSRG